MMNITNFLSKNFNKLSVEYIKAPINYFYSNYFSKSGNNHHDNNFYFANNNSIINKEYTKIKYNSGLIKQQKYFFSSKPDKPEKSQDVLNNQNKSINLDNIGAAPETNNNINNQHESSNHTKSSSSNKLFLYSKLLATGFTTYGLYKYFTSQQQETNIDTDSSSFYSMVNKYKLPISIGAMGLSTFIAYKFHKKIQNKKFIDNLEKNLGYNPNFGKTGDPELDLGLTELGLAFNAKSHFNKGKYHESIKLYQESIKIDQAKLYSVNNVKDQDELQKIHEHNQSVYLSISSSMSSIASCYEKLPSSSKQTVDHYEQAIEFNQKAEICKPIDDNARIYNNIAMLYRVHSSILGNVDNSNKSLEQSTKYFDKSVNELKTIYNGFHPRILKVLQEKYDGHLHARDSIGMINTKKEMLEIQLELNSGKANKEVLDTIWTIICDYDDLKDYEKIIEYCNKSIELAKGLPSTAENKIVISNSISRLGKCYAEMGDIEKGIQIIMNAEDISSYDENSLQSMYNYRLAKAYKYIAGLSWIDKNPISIHLDKAIELYLTVTPKDIDQKLSLLWDIANTYRENKQYDEAIEYYQKEIDVIDNELDATQGSGIIDFSHNTTQSHSVRKKASMSLIASCYDSKGDLESSLKWRYDILDFLNEVQGDKITESKQDTYSSIYYLYNQLGDEEKYAEYRAKWKEAYNYLKNNKYNGINSKDNDGLSLLDLESNLDLINKHYNDSSINYKLVSVDDIILNDTQCLYLINPEGDDSKFSDSLKSNVYGANIINANIQKDNSTCSDHSLILLTKILELGIPLSEIGIATVENEYGKHANLYIIGDSNIDLSSEINRVINSYKQRSGIIDVSHDNTDITDYLAINDLTVCHNIEDITLLGDDVVEF